MADLELNDDWQHRDGTSQAARPLVALDPDYVRVDERTVVDWLRFARSYGRQLVYFNERNEASGTWSALFELTDEELEGFARYLENPVGVVQERYRRPHFVLFLAFLEALRPVQGRLNAFTRRHLEHDFQDVLGFVPHPAISDQVHVLIEPAARRPEFLLPEGTLLKAGPDGVGGELRYRTDGDLVVNQCRVVEARTLYLHRSRVGLDEVRRNPEVLVGLLPRPDGWVHLPPVDKAFLAMLELALRDPASGIRIPKFPRPGTDGLEVTPALLGDLDKMLAVVVDQLYLPLPVFQSVMELKRRLDPALEPAATVWRRVNETLRKAGATKTGNANFKLPPAAPDDFPANLDGALGLPKTAYDGLPEVNDVYGVYRHMDDPEAIEVREFVRTQLHLGLEVFRSMMSAVEGFHQDWRRLNDVLRSAGRRRQRKEPAHKVEAVEDLRVHDPQRWEGLVARNLGVFQPPVVAGQALGTLDAIFDEMGRLTQCLRMSPQNYRMARQVGASGEARPWDWDEVYGIFRKAAADQALNQRREAIRRARRGAPTPQEAIEAMARQALGTPEPGDPLPGGRGFLDFNPDADAERLADDFFLTPDSVRFIQGLAAPGAVVHEADWEAAVNILEQAQRRVRGENPDGMELEAWENLYAAEDATKVGGGVTAGATEGFRWRTFGDRLREDGATRPGAVGFLVESPLLAMVGGDRTVVLSVGLANEGLERDALEEILKGQTEAPPLRFRLSTEKGMVEAIGVSEGEQGPVQLLTGAAAKLGGSLEAVPWVLQIRVRFDVQAPAVVPAPGGSGVPTQWPVLEVQLRDLGPADRPIKRYGVFRSLQVIGILLQVDVQGLADPIIRNDEVPLDPRKPFEPFGSFPMVGSRFVLAHPEICSKRIDAMQVGVDWLGAPANFAEHYANYAKDGKVKITGAASFTANLRLVDNRAAFAVKTVPLFESKKNAATGHIGEACWFGVSRAEVEAKYPGYGWARDLRAEGDPLDWVRSWQLELAEPDFQHSEYPQAAARGAVLTDGGTPPKPTPRIPNPPYTPKIKRMRIYYRASVELDPAQGVEETDHRLYHVEPFGYARPWGAPKTGEAATGAAHRYLFPQHDDEGQLFLGLGGVTAPQNVALLLQMAAGSADPDLARGTVHWSVLDGDEWRTLDEGRVLSDTTRGLLNTGIVALDLPVVRPGTRLPGERYWLRAAVARDPRSVSDLVAIHTQAVTATVAGTVGPVRASLSPGTISGLATPRPEVAKVLQPYSSFGGSAGEESAAFYLRVSERLRHKDRAVTCWDYERIVLEAFPEIYKAKCLPVGCSEDPRESERVRLIVIPDIRNRRPFDPFEPKVPAETLRAIEEHLSRRSPALARVQVRNPKYVALQLRFGVRFRAGRNPGFYLKTLNDDLQRYLAPWAYDESADIVLGGRIHANLLVHFIEQRPYVDYLAGMSLFLSDDGVQFRHVTSEELEGRQQGATGAESVLVSAREHFIDLILDELYVEESFVGINHMRIELDFRVAENRPATRAIPNLKSRQRQRHATNPRRT